MLSHSFEYLHNSHMLLLMNDLQRNTL